MKSFAINDGLSLIRARFLEMLPAHEANILTDLDRAVIDFGSASAPLARIETILHRVAGTAGMLGYDDLGICARTAENLIILCKDDETKKKDAMNAVITYLEASFALTAH